MYTVGRAIPARDEVERARERPLQIELEIPCSRCGYVLAGLKTDGVCPECGAAVRLSVYGDRLEYAAPGWVRGLWVGALAVQLSVGLMVCALVATVVPIVIQQTFWGFAPPRVLMVMFYATFYVMPGLCSAAALGGWWLLTMPDPALAGKRDDPRSRRVLRVVIGVEGVCWVVLAGLGLGGLLGAVPPGVYVPLASVCGMGAPLAMLVHVLAATRWARAMGPRLRSGFVEEVCWWQRVVAWSATVMVVLCVAAVMGQWDSVILVLLLGAFVAVCALGVAHVVMVGMVRRSAGEGRGRNGK